MAVTISEDRYMDLTKKECAIKSMKRVLEISNCIDADDFYICTGIKVTGKKPGEVGASTGKTIEEDMHDYTV